MPTYEYACQSCGHKFDIWQEVGASAPACEKCGEAVKKVFHPPRVIFKGSGFYVTDLRSEKNAQSGKSDGDSGEKSEPKTETSSASTDSKASEPKSTDSKSSSSDSKSTNSSNSSAPSTSK